MAPPGGCPAEPDQPRRLGRHAVRRHQLLLLADRVGEAERVHAEADYADDRHREQGGRRAQRDPQPLAPARCAEHEERQRKTRRELHAHARRQRGRCRARSPARPRAQRQRRAECQQQQRVVVRAPHSQHQQDRVQAQERGCPRRRLAETPSGTRDQRDCAEAGDDCDCLERPQAPRQPQGCDRIAREREHRTVR
jgi:hypothetical protein